MNEYFSTDSVSIYHGDCRDVLKTLNDDSIDAVVCDPPYELNFMQRKWDNTGIAFDVSMWREVLRVLKPGGHLLSFGGTRTYHRVAVAIEDAGFEIRDCLQWLYGTGFPKSLNISKAIDAKAGAERTIIGFRKGQGSIPNDHGEWGLKPNELVPISLPSTNAAKQWEGWGTALKPACEPIVLARKPLEGTVAENVLAHETGGINVDGCRIGTDEGPNSGAKGNGGVFGASDTYTNESHVLGRWPANVLLDEDAAKMLDEQTFDKIHSAGVARDKLVTTDYNATSFNMSGTTNMRRLGDDVGASRFFYIAKASRSEREYGCDDLPLRSPGEVTGDRKEDSDGLNSPRAGAGRTSGARNFHPTVKPIALMEYLVRLVTPPSGVVLDPFMGSGSTGIACIRQGFKFIGIEIDNEYINIARARLNISYIAKEPPLRVSKEPNEIDAAIAKMSDAQLLEMIRRAQERKRKKT